ncbi:IS110 family transposase [Halanaerobium congolense]|jgi:transposase|uniref:Transposase IS116/IS110/IS902 family protein n=2 Tax=Halanaerobium congolense TaxID=54121 RepID=A0A1G6T5M3_9FIRM|nr:IS110 family transposase [Halanaerobium congolense]SDD24460.1 Transposase IS116/IS110/IS902 family protein [Halanaerobium congolense]SHM98302.1 Transposase IS116/IS110/IS902 family protein [Halanaerobium congolense]
MGKVKHIKASKRTELQKKLRDIPYDKVLVVAIDPAKYSPKALICNYFGEILVNPFFFTINSKGLNLLLTKIQETVNNISAQKVLVCIETTGHYHEIIVRYLQEFDYDVLLINAYTTSESRAENLNWSKTDNIDLFAIASALIDGKTTKSRLLDGNYEKLKDLCRYRRYEVQKRSAIKSKIRVLMDKIWPNFQGKGKIVNGTGKVEKIFSKFWGKAPLFIMKNYPHPSLIKKFNKTDLREISRKNNLKFRNSTIEKLLLAAENSYARPYEELEVEIELLTMTIADYENANQKIELLRDKIENILVQNPGLLLLSVPEIGVVTAAEFSAEMGPATQYDYAGQVIKTAGTNPLVKESGGKKARYGSISKQGNPSFRHIVYLVGKSLATGKTNPYFKSYAERLRKRDKNPNQIYIAAGNKFIRVTFAMLRDHKLFDPPMWKGESLTSNIFDKIDSPENKEIALKTLENYPGVNSSKLTG